MKSGTPLTAASAENAAGEIVIIAATVQNAPPRMIRFAKQNPVMIFLQFGRTD
jgi:hypothetical protein